MSGSLLTYLDILIGFTLVMLLASSIVTVLSQWLLNLKGTRAVVLQEGLQRLLNHLLDASLKDHADKIAEKVLLHPLVARDTWYGKDRKGAVIQREQLVRVLLDIAAEKLPTGHDGSTENRTSSSTSGKTTKDTKGSNNPPENGCACIKKMLHQILNYGRTEGVSQGSQKQPADKDAPIEALRLALGFNETDQDTPKAVLETIEARVMQLEGEFPNAAAHVLRARAIIENASTRFIPSLMAQFDEISERMTQYFAQRARALTILLSAVVAILLPLDSLDLLRRLSLDEALRSRLVEAAEKLEQQPGTTERIEDQSRKGTAPSTDQPPGEAAATPKQLEETQPNSPSAPTEYAEVQRLRDDLKALAIVPMGGVWTFVQSEGWGKLLNAIPGILLSICLMSFGAPFWFEALKHLLKLRSALAQTEEKERQERKDILPASSGLAFAARESEAGDLNADAIASHPDGQG